MKLLMKLAFFIVLLVNSGLTSLAQNDSITRPKDVITKVAKFKPPIVKSYLGTNTNGAAITVDEASELIALPLTITDDKKNIYSIDSYHFLYKRKGVIQDEETGKKSVSFTNLADFFKTTPLPKVWIDNLKNGFQKDEELYFFDIIVTDSKNRKFFAPNLKIMIQ
jgi:hypothetical protein